MAKYINKDEMEQRFRKLARVYFDRYYLDKTDSESRCKALGYDRAADEVRRTMTINVYDGWINAEEKVPDNDVPVLVWYEYWRYGNYNCMWQAYGIAQYIDRWTGDDLSGSCVKVLAWQPLPEPPIISKESDNV